MGKSKWKVNRPGWLSAEDIASTDLYRRHVFKKRKDRIGILQELMPPEEIGRPVGAHRLVEVVLESGCWDREKRAQAKVLQFMKSLRRLLKERRKSGSPLNRAVILSCLVDYIKSTRSLTRKEIDARAYFRKKGLYRDAPSDRKTHYRDELLSILMFTEIGGDGVRVPCTKTMEASECLAKGLTWLGVELGEQSKTRGGELKIEKTLYDRTKSELRQDQNGEQIASAASSIRHAFGNNRRKPTSGRG